METVICEWNGKLFRAEVNEYGIAVIVKPLECENSEMAKESPNA